MNAHAYDGKLSLTLLPIIELTLEEKRLRGLELIEAVKTKNINPIAISFLRRIVKAIGTAANKDNSNNLCADDLICLCWYHRENSDFLAELEIQLLDMRTGFCPQGRTHRLFQILLPYI
ncbi:MAG: hypothetical protein ABIQ41_12480 [Gemmatimonadales bacterium]